MKMKIEVVLYVDRCRRTVFTTGDEVLQTGKNIETVSGELWVKHFYLWWQKIDCQSHWKLDQNYHNWNFSFLLNLLYYFSTLPGDPWQRGHLQHRGLVALPADRGLRPQTAAPLQPQQDGLPQVIFVGVIIVRNFFMKNVLKEMASTRRSLEQPSKSISSHSDLVCEAAHSPRAWRSTGWRRGRCSSISLSGTKFMMESGMIITSWGAWGHPWTLGHHVRRGGGQRHRSSKRRTWTTGERRITMLIFIIMATVSAILVIIVIATNHHRWMSCPGWWKIRRQWLQSSWRSRLGIKQDGDHDDDDPKFDIQG